MSRDYLRETPIRVLASGPAREALRSGKVALVVIPGDPAGSLLIKRLEGTITPKMPEPRTAPSLSGNEIDTIKQWILEGAQEN